MTCVHERLQAAHGHLGYWGDVVATTGPRVCFQVCVVRIFAATDVNIPGMV